MNPRTWLRPVNGRTIPIAAAAVGTSIIGRLGRLRKKVSAGYGSRRCSGRARQPAARDHLPPARSGGSAGRRPQLGHAAGMSGPGAGRRPASGEQGRPEPSSGTEPQMTTDPGGCVAGVLRLP